MKTTSLIETANHFWKLFSAFDQDRSTTGAPRNENLRHRCALGFLALDATLNVYWREIVMSEWSEFTMLTSTVLADGASLDRLGQISAPEFSRGQWAASLRFLNDAVEIDRFSPNVIDVVAALAVNGSSRLADPGFVAGLKLLLRLQRMHNHCLQTGKDWSETLGFEGVRLLQEFQRTASAVHPLFGDAIKPLREKQDIAA